MHKFIRAEVKFSRVENKVDYPENLKPKAERFGSVHVRTYVSRVTRRTAAYGLVLSLSQLRPLLSAHARFRNCCFRVSTPNLATHENNKFEISAAPHPNATRPRRRIQ
jgi:hypothetical protein